MPVPRVPRHPDAAPTLRAETDARLTAELASVVAGARRRALRDGDRQIDTAHLLHSLMEADPAVRAAFDGAGQVARVLGYLVQRSIGYGLRWQGSVEDSGALPLLRAGGGGGGGGGGHARDGDGDHAPDGDHAVARDIEWAVAGWSPSASAALDRALERAAPRREDPRATGIDLLGAIAADPGCRAVEVLEHAGVDTALLARRIGELSQQV
ncbi:Clp protease N-terminal domain-containing protein [Streptomyces sp. NPDC007861]|uniref:Clp protease N-terminal domain-containing protein n=1 Tax=Streptomyces sp. NPDC007861 TaxID=3154893 RepID=UPI0033F8ADCE